MDVIKIVHGWEVLWLLGEFSSSVKASLSDDWKKAFVTVPWFVDMEHRRVIYSDLRVYVRTECLQQGVVAFHSIYVFRSVSLLLLLSFITIQFLFQHRHMSTQESFAKQSLFKNTQIPTFLVKAFSINNTST